MGEEARGRGAVNPACPNADNPFHRCAEYCPVAAPAPAASKPRPARAAQNGTGEEAEAGGRQRQAVNPDCPNAENPFHRCAEYCPVPAPAPAAAARTFPLPPGPGREIGQNGRTQSDGDLRPTERRRDRAAGGSGGLPLYVFLREEGKKVDPRCPNAANPFHVCTNHCLPKMVEGGRSSEGGKSPMSLFSRHSSRSSSSSEGGSVKSGGSKKANPKCPNAGNPFHECGEHCTAKIKEAEKQKKIDKKLARKKGGKDNSPVQNWKVDPRCPHAGNPFHICAQYCFDSLNEAAPTAPSKPDSRKGKAAMKAEPTGEINPDCANASNPYHKCGEYCKRNGNR
uniref:Uncharacterized protein n=1 Tax=Avena sativa TaxID=4498 RepID=A0ACD5UGM3_AVESA